MKKGFIFLLFLWQGVCVNVFSQEILWKAGVQSFFENNEFAKSKVNIPQTMAGVHLAPEIGLKWNDNHRIFAGFDAMHEWGSDKTVDFFNPLVYYEFSGKHFRFYTGAFPRKLALGKYPRMFFRDSIQNYRPTITGMFWEYVEGNNYMNVWLDWVSRQTYTRREAFFLGWSGKYAMNIFYGQHFGYMLHFAHTMQPERTGGLHDNLLMLTSLGVDLASKTNFEKLEANAGWVVGLERDRSLDNWKTPQGFMSEAIIEYKGLEIHHILYKGKGQQIFCADHGSALYWGDPMYRTELYNRTDLSVWFYKSNVVNLKMTWSLHFAEQTMYHSQLFTASFELDNLKRKGQNRYRYLWDRWVK